MEQELSLRSEIVHPGLWRTRRSQPAHSETKSNGMLSRANARKALRFCVLARNIRSGTASGVRFDFAQDWQSRALQTGHTFQKTHYPHIGIVGLGSPKCWSNTQTIR